MKISAISSNNYQLSNKNFNNQNLAKKTVQHEKPAFKGVLGESAGSALGMFCGVVATLFTGPLTALAIAGIGCVGGGIAGGKIEDKMNEKNNDKK